MADLPRDIRNILPYFLFPLFVYIFSIFLIYFDVYNILSWIDIPMHLLGGFSVGVAYFYCIKYFESRNFLRTNGFFKMLFVLSLVALTAVLWEFHEFLVDYFFGTNWQKGIADTMLDLFMGILGGFVAAVFLIFKEEKTIALS